MNGVANTAVDLALAGTDSEELGAALRLVADAGGAAGPRYHPGVIRELTRVIATRAYGRPVLELTHLLHMTAILSRRQGYPAFFWGVAAATSGAFRDMAAMMARRPPADAALAVDMGGLAYAFPDGEFAVRYGRMPFLAALLEFLVTVLGFPAVDAVAAASSAGGMRLKAVSAKAQDLSDRLTGYLHGRLPARQHQRKFAALVEHLVRRNGRGFAIDAVDDEAVLSFWTGAACGGEPVDDFRTFRATLEAFVRFRRALALAGESRALVQARPIGQDRSVGEVDPGTAEAEALAEALAGDDEDAGLLDLLAAPPADRVKLLNKRETAALAQLASSGVHAAALPLSHLRAEVFGDQQSRLIEAARRRLAAGERRRLADEAPAESYRDRQALLHHLAAHCRTCRLAALHVLAWQRRPEAVALLLDLAPGLDARSLAGTLAGDGEDGTVVSLAARRLADRLLDALAGGTPLPNVPGSAELPALVLVARRAHGGIARKGFTEEERAEPATADAFAAAAGPLRRLEHALAGFLAALDRSLAATGPDGQFAADRGAFAAAFRYLYGDDDE
jgi:hypothetical protein